jgi:Flp pilus assembly protein TadB
MMWEALLGVTVAGTTFFLLNWFGEVRRYRAMSRLERLDAQIDEEQRLLERRSLGDTVNEFAVGWGLQGLWAPALGLVTVMYLSMAAVLALAGIGDLVGGLIALPTAAVLGLFLLRTSKQREELRFRKQLLQAFGIIAAQIEAGDSINRAIDKTVLMVEDPLRRELASAMAQMIGTTTLTTALRPVAAKYPSRAIELFLAALEIDETMGAKLAPTRRQAQTTLERQFDLAAEATAEISQARAEFFGITIVMALVAGGMFTSAEGIARDAYSSPLGVAVITGVVANYLFGIVRTARIFAKAKRGES